MSGLLNSQITQTVRNIHMNQNFIYEGPVDDINRYTVFQTQELRPYNSSATQINSIMKGKDLLTFTHEYDERPELLKKIDPKRSFWANAFHVLYGDVFYRGAYYDNYIDFVNGVYGQIPPPIQFIQSLISTQFLDEAIRLDEVGVVHNPEPALSVGGAVKTNINNFSGTDTHLGLLSNQIYAHSLINSSAINTFRKETDSYKSSLITPSASKVFGMTNYTIENPRAIQDYITTEEGYVLPVYIIHYRNQLFKGVEQEYKKTRKLRKALRDQYNQELPEGKKKYKIKDIDKYGRQQKLNKETGKYEEVKGEIIGEAFIGDINIQNLNDVLNNASMWYIDNDMISWYNKDYCLLGDSFYQGMFKLGKSFQNDKKIDLMDFERLLPYDALYELSKSIEDNPDIRFAGLSKESLIHKTNLLFRNEKINKFGVYYNEKVDRKFTTKETTISDTSTTDKGRSIGRNLTTVYDDPKRTFCRAWTNRSRYELVSDLIKPHDDEYSEEPKKEVSIETIQSYNNPRRPSNDTITNGGKYLAENTVLDENGFVRITPAHNGKRTNIKDCMFSIENLAWKDVANKNEYLSKEQRGPLGGRIMWFPPYDLNFEESANVAWEGNSFIGRGEKMYTYSNTDRTGTLSFTLLIDHPSVIQNIYNKDGQILKNPNTKKTFTDDDILRYFAGCAPIEPPIIPDTPPSDDTSIRNEVKPKYVDKKIKIYVYFPNNYTGHWHNLVRSSSEETTTIPDEDFLAYMLFGINSTTSSEEFNSETNEFELVKYRGYEMIHDGGEGLTDLGHTFQNLEYRIQVCDNNKLYNDCSATTNENYYYYRVDKDLRQKLLKEHNYKDTRSFGLNSHNTTDNNSKKGYFSFLELAWVLLDRAKKTGTKQYVEKHYGHLIRKDEINKYFAPEVLKRITNINFRGNATVNDRKNSIKLAKRRGATLKHLFKESFPEIKEELLTIQPIGTESHYSEDISDLPSKSNRFAVVEITYNVAETDELFINIDKHGNKKNTNNEGKMTAETQYQTVRYETESEYFERLSTNDYFLHKQLVDKFKYFDPAFHSISPEGFNARLTFLQQCTRQGHSMENINNTSLDPSAIIASNLSFGRPPICVLRLGDFIHTRIIIQNMSISYGDDGIQWDLNPDGIGVQPMMAKVSMQIVILGGQSLEAPLTRLQNAVTFNYYANAGVYDDRADRARPSDTNEFQTEYYWAWEPQNTYTVDNQNKQDALTTK